VGEVLATLPGTSAGLVDAACRSDSDAAAYARAACLRVHVAVLSELSGRIAPVRTGEPDPWERIARELEATSAPGAFHAATDGWNAAGKALAEDSASWPEDSGTARASRKP
jgi:hypothetical protein